jgi:hypothetical protein
MADLFFSLFFIARANQRIRLAARVCAAVLQLQKLQVLWKVIPFEEFDSFRRAS